MKVFFVRLIVLIIYQLKSAESGGDSAGSSPIMPPPSFHIIIDPTVAPTNPPTRPPTKSTADPPTIPPSPLLNVDACNQNSPVNGKFLCYVKTSKSYEAADAYCRANGMQLFVVNDDTTSSQFKQAAQLLSGTSNGVNIWINGVKEMGWTTREPPAPVIPSITQDGAALNEPGDCLQTYKPGFGQEYSYSAQNCGTAQYFICEFRL